jgi:H+-translocating diphosphatase
MCSYVFSKDDGTEAMRAVSDPIREGAEGFLKVQYGAIFKIAIVLAGIILLSYSLRPANKESTGVGAVSPLLMGILASLSFGVGAGCSAFAGYISMWVSASTNIRVTSAARRSYGECLEICFRGGAFSAVLCITLCVFGVSMLYFILSVCFVNSGILKPADVPVLMVGYGFGASFVALFMQLGGGIYTKAADVGADMVGKIEV